MKKDILQFAVLVALTCAPSMYGAVKQQLVFSDGLGDSITVNQDGTFSTTGTATIVAGNIFVDGVGSITVASNGSGTVTVGTFKINSAEAFGLADSVSPEIQDQITLDTSSTGTGTLNIQYTDTTYANLAPTLSLTGSESTSNTPATSVTFTAYGSGGVALPATTALGSIGPLTGFSANSSTSVTNPFTGASASVSSLAKVIFSGAGTFNTTFSISSAPAITCPATSAGEVGLPFNSPAITVTGGTAPFTFSVATGTLPPGLTLNTSTGAITGTPTAAGSFTIKVTDANGLTAATTCPFTITGGPVLTCSATSTGEVGSPFNSPAPTVTGGTAPFTFSVATGTLPPGLTLNTSTGAITGTPTAAGSFTIQVKDANGVVGSGTCPFIITSQTVLLTCSTTATGMVGVPFDSPALMVTGGTPPYTFSVATGTLPPGLTLNTSTGAITGTPTAPGSFTIQVMDANGVDSTGTCAYSIGTPPSTCTTPAFQVRYASNLNIGESYINIANPGTDGAPLLGPGFGSASGNVCVNVYAFDAGEELISCCSCLVTPDETVNLGVNADLTVKTLTGVVPTSVTVKLVATLAGPGGAGTSCSGTAALVATATPACGLLAWGTTLHGVPGGFGTTETPFTPATPSAAELASLSGRCASIMGNGSGFGICNSCRSGALGAGAIQQ
jgi:hypothetical protein